MQLALNVIIAYAYLSDSNIYYKPSPLLSLNDEVAFFQVRVGKSIEIAKLTGKPERTESNKLFSIAKLFNNKRGREREKKREEESL